MSFAVDTNIMVGGIKSGAKLFDKEGCGRLSLDGELFTDKIEPYGVRAYRIKLADNPKPIQVSLDMTALKNEKMASVDIPGIVSQVKRGKNHIPNPCFKQQFVKGIPDFYKPTSFPIDHETGRQGSTWYVDNETMWNGNPSLRIFRGKGNLGRGMCGLWYPPESDKPMKMTFSFYAKCNKVGAKMSANVFDKKWKPITLTSTAWTRYSITGVIPPGVHGNLDGRSFQISSPTGATLWITGLQMEAGEIPTEFQDDSIPKNTD
jgi:hypothetical protein